MKSASDLFVEKNIKQLREIETINRYITVTSDEDMVTKLMFASIDEIKQIEKIYNSIVVDENNRPYSRFEKQTKSVIVLRAIRDYIGADLWGDQNAELFRSFDESEIDIKDSIDIKKLFMTEKHLKLFDEIGTSISGFGFNY